MAATQIRFPSRATVRTMFQVVVGLATVTPALVDSLGLKATGYLGIVLAVAATITRVMAMPAVEDFLQKNISWLAAKPAPPEEEPADVPVSTAE